MTLKEIELEWHKAFRRYSDVQQKLANPDVDIHAVAQEANDAYLEFKKIDREMKTVLIIKESQELYGC